MKSQTIEVVRKVERCLVAGSVLFHVQRSEIHVDVDHRCGRGRGMVSVLKGQVLTGLQENCMNSNGHDGSALNDPEGKSAGRSYLHLREGK